MLSVCSVTPSCSSQSKITFHGGLRPFLPFPKDFQVGSHVTADGSFTGLLRGTQFHGGFPKAFTTRSSLSNLTMNAQHPLSTGEGTLLDVSGLRSEITSAQVLPIQHETGLGDKIASEKMLFLSDSLNVDNSSVSNLKASTEDFLDRVSESFNASIQQGENTIEKSLDTINSFVSSLIKRGNQSVDDAVSSIFSSVDQIGEQGSNKVTNFSSGLKEGSIKASIAAIDLLRHAVVAIEDSLINATSFVVYSYGSAKELFPPEIRIALSSSEQKVAEILSPVKTGFQQIYPTVESLEKIVGLDPSDPLVPFFLLVGSSVTLWIFYWTNTYGGYSGDLSPEATLELLKGSDNAVLIDVRPEDLREKDGIPDLRRGARARYTSVTLPEVDGSIRKLVTNGRDLDDTLLASVIRNLNPLTSLHFNSMFLRASLLKFSSFYSIPCHPLLPVSLSSSICSSPRTPFSIRCHSAFPLSHEPSSSASSEFPDVADNRWRPTCLYFTHGRCTMMDDPLHIKKFNHDISRELQVDVARSNHMRTQDFDYFLVLDLEGKVEIIEFPVILVNAKTMGVTGFFHRFVRPSRMSEQRINEYIEGKYGKFGVDRVWHDTAILYKDVIQQFEDWLVQHQLWRKELGGVLDRAAFVTCGNWDIKTQVPHQCSVSKMKLPDYFMEWINIKDVYLNFYAKKATGMATMMRQLEMPLVGSHHLGIDDTKNIVRVLQRMVGDGAHLQVTARRNPKSPQHVKFLFENRI